MESIIEAEEYEEAVPALSVRFLVGGGGASAVENIAERAGVGTKLWPNGWRYAAVHESLIELEPAEVAEERIERFAQELEKLCATLLQDVDRENEVQIIEVRMTIRSRNSINADFYAPRGLLKTLWEYNIDLYIAAS